MARPREAVKRTALLLLALVAVSVAGTPPRHDATIVIHQIKESCHQVDTLGAGHVMVRLICSHDDTILVAEVFEDFVDVPSRQLKQAVEESDESLDALKHVLDEYRKQQEGPP